MLGFLKKFFRRSSAGRRAGVNRSQPASADRKQSWNGSAGSDQDFARVVAGVRDYAIFLLDEKGIVRTWNAGAERMKGYRSDEIIGQHFSCFYPKDRVLAGWPAHELRVAAETGRFEEESWRLRKDGSRFWANVVITALRNGSSAVHGYLKITRDLTDRKQAEVKLRLSEERFRLMVEGVRDYAIFMLSPQGIVTTWNAGAERIKGYKADEIIGEHFSRFYPSEAVARGWPAEELKRATAQGRFEDEGWRVRKDGSQFWASVIITPLWDEAGTLVGFGKVTRDLTERMHSEENARRLLQEEAARQATEEAAREIQRERRQLQVTLSSIGDAVIVTDERGMVTFLNPAAVALTGWEAHEAAGKPLEQIFRIINELTGRAVDNPVERVLREGVVVGLANHTVLVARDGREIPIDDSGAPIREEGEAITGAVLVFRDVTESRQATETRLYLAAIVESSDDAIIGQTLDGMIASWNRGAERLYGYTEEEIIGKPLSVLVPTDHPDELPELIERCKRGELIEHLETQRIRKDGSRVEVSLTISPVRNAEGKIVGASKISRDITARKEEDRRKSEFIALLAHELRNPLAPLRNALQVMRLAGADQAAVEQSRQMMERQLQYLTRLVDDLLDVSRISLGKLHLQKERLSISEVVQNALEICEALVRNQDHELTVALTEEPMFLDADKTRLAQALCNLLNNAVKYSAAGSRVRLAAWREGNEAVISVKDAGVGIPREMLPRVFDLFTQIDRSLEKAQGGLGVGLTIVKRLVEMHGGRVEARSEGHGQGSEFFIRLPLVPSFGREPSERNAPAVPKPVNGHRILVVDDNADSATSLAMLLKFKGYETRTAQDGAEGMQRAAEFQPDLILLDIGMPKINGYEVCRRIREESWGKPIRIVALTGWGQDEDKRRSAEAGFNGHLVKPVEPAALDRLLTELEAPTAAPPT
jgi:PAS domain S-box-containing protein